LPCHWTWMMPIQVRFTIVYCTWIGTISDLHPTVHVRYTSGSTDARPVHVLLVYVMNFFTLRSRLPDVYRSPDVYRLPAKKIERGPQENRKINAHLKITTPTTSYPMTLVGESKCRHAKQATLCFTNILTTRRRRKHQHITHSTPNNILFQLLCRLCHCSSAAALFAFAGVRFNLTSTATITRHLAEFSTDLSTKTI
jgi:hypothetical protein